jgi:hypothetical protein
MVDDIEPIAGLSPVAVRSPKRTRIPGLDLRTGAGRRVKALIADYAKPLGGIGAMSARQRSIVEQIAAVEIQSQAVRARLVCDKYSPMSGDPERREDVDLLRDLSRQLRQLEADLYAGTAADPKPSRPSKS